MLMTVIAIIVVAVLVIACALILYISAEDVFNNIF